MERDVQDFLIAFIFSKSNFYTRSFLDFDCIDKLFWLVFSEHSPSKIPFVIFWLLSYSSKFRGKWSTVLEGVNFVRLFSWSRF